MIVAFSLVPSGGRASREDGGVADAVAAAVRVVRDSGLPNHTSSMFTEIEGSWDEVMDIVKGEKLSILRFRRRKHSMRKIGHRQKFTKIQIKEIKAG